MIGNVIVGYTKAEFYESGVYLTSVFAIDLAGGFPNFVKEIINRKLIWSTKW